MSPSFTRLALKTLILFPTWTLTGYTPRSVLEALGAVVLLGGPVVIALRYRRGRPAKGNPPERSRDAETS